MCTCYAGLLHTWAGYCIAGDWRHSAKAEKRQGAISARRPSVPCAMPCAPPPLPRFLSMRAQRHVQIPCHHSDVCADWCKHGNKAHDALMWCSGEVVGLDPRPWHCIGRSCGVLVRQRVRRADGVRVISRVLAIGVSLTPDSRRLMLIGTYACAGACLLCIINVAGLR